MYNITYRADSEGVKKKLEDRFNEFSKLFDLLVLGELGIHVKEHPKFDSTIIGPRHNTIIRGVSPNNMGNSEGLEARFVSYDRGEIFIKTDNYDYNVFVDTWGKD